MTASENNAEVLQEAFLVYISSKRNATENCGHFLLNEIEIKWQKTWRKNIKNSILFFFFLSSQISLLNSVFWPHSYSESVGMKYHPTSRRCDKRTLKSVVPKDWKNITALQEGQQGWSGELQASLQKTELTLYHVCSQEQTTLTWEALETGQIPEQSALAGSGLNRMFQPIWIQPAVK